MNIQNIWGGLRGGRVATGRLVLFVRGGEVSEASFRGREMGLVLGQYFSLYLNILYSDAM